MVFSKYRVLFFIFGLSLVTLFIGAALGGRQGLLAALALVLLMNYISFFYSVPLLKWTYDAKPLEGSDPYGLHKILTQLAQKAEIPKPKLFLIYSETPNVFSFGRGLNNSSIVITDGAIRLLQPDELEAILAHEIFHISHSDTVLMMAAAGLSSMIMYVADFLNWLATLGRPSKERKHPNNTTGRILTSVVSPVGAGLVRLAVRKKREFEADKGAVEWTKKPGALASALWKIHNYSVAKPLPATDATAHLFIINPLPHSNLFNTHPLIEERIKRLLGRTP